MLYELLAACDMKNAENQVSFAARGSWKSVMRYKLLAAFLCLIPISVLAEKATYLELARKGWNYHLRTTMVGRDMSIPVVIHGRSLSGAALCIVGEEPHAATLATLKPFLELLKHAFGKSVSMRYAGPTVQGCGSGRVVVLRLYSGFPPNRALSADIAWMNDAYALGLPKGRNYAVSSPAMAQTFFGRRGQATHIMVKQPAFERLGEVERAFFRSILIEELFQTFTFGMDILLFERGTPFTSKLQETPVNLSRLSWESREFMRALLRSNPNGLCRFDLFMLHAVARAPVTETVEPAFITFIEDEFDNLTEATNNTVSDPEFQVLLDPDCSAI